MGLFCSNCGNQLREGAKFCNKCGSKVNTDETSNNIQNTNQKTNPFSNSQISSFNPFQNNSADNFTLNNKENHPFDKLNEETYNNIFKELKKIIAKYCNTNENNITLETTFRELGISETTYVQICLDVDEKYGFYILNYEPNRLKKVKGFVELIFRSITNKTYDDNLNDLFDEPNTVSVSSALLGGSAHGFKKGFTQNSGCFITTAVCDSFNKTDNCYELTTFRYFRDNWLINEEDGKALIKEYYKNAPKIVETINSYSNKADIYLNIWNTYLKKCLHFIEDKKYKECKTLYIKMVKDLEKKYLL